MEKVKVSERQTYIDLAIQLYGDVSQAFELAEQNGMSITDAILPGTDISYDPELLVNYQMVNNIRKSDMTPVSDETISDVFSQVFNDIFF